jgi:hypothetical protein
MEALRPVGRAALAAMFVTVVPTHCWILARGRRGRPS